MGRAIYDNEPVFKKVLNECSAELAQHREGDLIQVMFEDGEALGDTFWTQPALFAFHLALAELMKSRGCQPDLVFGHSLGQYAAAVVAGMLDWKDGIRLIHERARLTGSLPAGGAMAAVFSKAEEVDSFVAVHEGLSIAAHNGSHTVISGPGEKVDAAMRILRKKKSDANASILLTPSTRLCSILSLTNLRPSLTRSLTTPPGFLSFAMCQGSRSLPTLFRTEPIGAINSANRSGSKEAFSTFPNTVATSSSNWDRKPFLPGWRLPAGVVHPKRSFRPLRRKVTTGPCSMRPPRSCFSSE